MSSSKETAAYSNLNYELQHSNLNYEFDADHWRAYEGDKYICNNLHLQQALYVSK